MKPSRPTHEHRHSRTARCLAPLAAALALMLLLVQAAPGEPPQVQLPHVIDRPLLWPESVAVNTAFEGEGFEVAAGDTLKVYSVKREGVAVSLPGDGGLTMIPHGWTDVVERANALAATLPEEHRGLTLANLVSRGDLFPPEVRLTETVEFDDKVREKGRAIGPYRLIRQGSDYLLAAIDPELMATGNIHQRQSYTLESTDFLPRLRARLAAEPAAEPRVAAELKGRLVDASGEPSADPAQPPKYYAVYVSAGWCGWCKKFDPTLVKVYQDLKAQHPEFEVVYLSSDRSEEEMLTHMREAGMTWPAVRFDERHDVPFLLGLVTGSTPQVVIVSAEGRIVHDGTPAGTNGANAALSALRRELRRSDR